MAELGLADSLDDETRAELDRIETGTPDLESASCARPRSRWRTKTARRRSRPATRTADAEQRERIELRSRASVGRYLTAALRGRAPRRRRGGTASKRPDVDGIPFELWDRPPRATAGWPD